MRRDHEKHTWDKYDMPQELEPTMGEKVLEIIGSIISGIMVFGILAALLCLSCAF